MSIAVCYGFRDPPCLRADPTTATSENREKLLRDFFAWCKRAGYEMQLWIERPTRNLEQINEVLQLYGRRLYEAGRPYGVFVESINSLVSFRPVLRRQLQPAWDVAFAWVREERPQPSHSHAVADSFGYVGGVSKLGTA